MRVLLVLAVLAAPAFADDDNAPSTTFHRHQLGISARFGVGVRGIATYNSEYCGKSDPGSANGNASVCTGRTPFAFDVEASYGVATHIELLAELRIGIERDFGTSATTDGPRALQLSPGARFFFSEAKRTKLFVQPEVVFDFANYTGHGKDVGFRALEGLWIDFHRAYGFYFYIGETAEFSRWIEADFTAGIGFQGRYP